MTKYRKKPVLIDAVQWNGSNIDEIMDFCDHDIETNTTKTVYYPCTVLVTYDGNKLTVLGSYEETLSKINGE